MKYKNLRKLNDYVQANGWELYVNDSWKDIEVQVNDKLLAYVDGYLAIDTSNCIGFMRLTDQQKRTLFDLLVEVAKLPEKERFEIEEEKEVE